MQFLACFLHEFSKGDKSVEDAMNKAYGQALKPYHNWSTRSIYSVRKLDLLSNFSEKSYFRLLFVRFLQTKIFSSH